MNYCGQVFLFIICYFFCCTGQSFASETIESGHRDNSRPLLLQLCQKTDLLVIGRMEGVSSTTGEYQVAVIEIERIIASAWCKEEISRHIDIRSKAKRISILQRQPFSDQSAVLLPNGRYLCWLSWAGASTRLQSVMGAASSACYEPVVGMNDYSILSPGIVLLNRLIDLQNPEEYARSQKILGKEPDWFEERNRKINFGLAKPGELVEAVTLFSGLMHQEKDNIPELNRLALSHEQCYSKIAVCLLKMGPSAKRFRHVDSGQKTSD